MKMLAVLGAVLASLVIHPALALEPEEAGREARDDLDALLDKQRQDREAAREKPKDEPSSSPSSSASSRPPSSPPAPPSSAAKRDRKKSKTIENRIPTICKGC